MGNKRKYPTTWGILNTIDTAAGYSVFAMKYLPAIITWMKLLKQRLNRKLNLDEVLQNPDKYTCQYVMDRCVIEKWGDIAVWKNAFNNFVEGWNHLARRVTEDREIENQAVDTVNLGVGKPAMNEPDRDNDDVKEDVPRPTDMDDEDEDEDDIKLIRKNQFKKFIKIANVCEALPIEPFVPKSTKRREILPVDVPLVFGMDSGPNGKLDTSIMIRRIVEHFISVNNRVLSECHGLGDHDDQKMNARKRELGLEPGLDSSYVSRAKDVVDIDEEELREMIQQCYQQKLRYGDAVADAVNWRLLESRLKERYITGRRLIIENLIEFEFAGQSNIPLMIGQIDRQHALVDPNKQGYFQRASPDLLGVLKWNVRQRALLNQNNIGDNYQNDGVDQVGGGQEQRRNQQQKKRMLDAYGEAKNAVKQTLVALQRQNQ